MYIYRFDRIKLPVGHNRLTADNVIKANHAIENDTL